MGAEGRADLLRSLGSALDLHPEFFASPSSEPAVEGAKTCRFGHVVDYLLAKANDKHEVRQGTVHIGPSTVESCI